MSIRAKTFRRVSKASRISSGGVAATREEDGGVSPGGVGYDINCGVRLVRSNLYFRDPAGHIAEFIGRGVFLPGVVLEGNRIKLEIGELQGDTPLQAAPGAFVDVLLRPDDILHDDASALQARVISKAFRGAQFVYTLELPGGGRVMSLVPSHHNHAIGEKIGIRLEMDHVVAFPRA